MFLSISWRRFLSQVEKDFALWIAFIIYFFLYRIFLLFYFGENVFLTFKASELRALVHIGFLFDMVPAFLFAAIPFIFSVLCAFFPLDRFTNRLRKYLLGLFTCFTVLLSLVNFFFFMEYKDQFNAWIFGMIYDDRTAILKTIWEDSPVIRFLLAWILGSVLLTWLFRKLLKLRPIRLTKIVEIRNKALRTLFVLCLVALCTGAARGGFRGRPIQMKDAAYTRNTFINRIIPNFYKALESTINIRRRNAGNKKTPEFLPKSGITTAAQQWFGKEANSIPEGLTKTAKGVSLRKKPKHIFLFVMESYDLWSFFPPYDKLGFTERGQALAKKGLFYSNFVSVGAGTTQAVSSIMTGIPVCDLELAYQQRCTKPFGTSIAEIFKALGFRTKFYYGGYLSWQNTGELANAQGFDEAIGANVINPDFPFGDWGLPDRDLFDYLYKDAAQEEAPTFHMLLSLSYHRPYIIDLKAEGYEPPVLTEETAHLNDNENALTVLGHLWYSDKILGEFIEKFADKFPDSLFIITGDHWSRRGLPRKYSNAWQENAVPCIIYGGAEILPELQAIKENLKEKGLVENGEIRIPGDHLDIAPTLVEMLAETGFPYQSYGSSLLDPDKDFASGGAHPCVLTGNTLILEANHEDFHVRETESVPARDDNLPIDEKTVEKLFERHNARKALGWWQVMRGDDIGSAP